MVNPANPQPALIYLNKITSVLIRDLFKSTVEMPSITIEKLRSGFSTSTREKSWVSEDESRYCLTLNSDLLNKEIEVIVTAILHELCHLYCVQHNIREVSRGALYHNKRFKEIANKVGLEVKYNSSDGWEETTPSAQLVEYIGKNGWVRMPMSTIKSNSKPCSTANVRKYQCPICGNSVRATKDVNIICGDCMVKMILVGERK